MCTCVVIEFVVTYVALKYHHNIVRIVMAKVSCCDMCYESVVQWGGGGVCHPQIIFAC